MKREAAKGDEDLMQEPHPIQRIEEFDRPDTHLLVRCPQCHTQFSVDMEPDRQARVPIDPNLMYPDKPDEGNYGC